jgi:uncharacterized protein
MPATAIPDVRVLINGAALPAAASEDLQMVTVAEDLDAMSMFTLVLGNWDQDRLEVSWSDSRLFAVGNQVEIWLGYVGDLHQVMLAEITSLEAAFSAEQTPSLTVRGYDHRHRLARGRKTRTFSQMKDSAIAAQLAREAGLRAQVTDSRQVLPYVAQTNQTDWAFLRRRARLIGNEIFVRDKVLYFRPPQFGAAPSARLSLGAEVTEFTPRLSSLGQAGEVSVRGWDVKQKEAVTRSGLVTTAMGSGAPGPSTARRAFGAATLTDVDLAVRSSGEADPMALGRFNAMALSYVQGEVVTQGDAQLRSGTVVQLAGAGRTFSGPYYVTSASHAVTVDSGYQTTLTVRRNAA